MADASTTSGHPAAAGSAGGTNGAASSEAGAHRFDATLEALLRDVDARPETVRAAIRAASDADLTARGLRGVQLNQLGAYRRWWSAERIREIAADTVRERLWGEWEFHAHLAHFARAMDSDPDDGSPDRLRSFVRLDGWEADRIAALAGGTGGLVVCSFHVGPFRFIPLDLYHLGFPVTIPLNRAAYDELFSIRENIGGDLRRRMGFRPVDARTSTIGLARALRRGEIVFAYVDGNIGADGETGTAVRSAVEFCGLRLRVKSGVPRLAAALGATLLPVVAERDGDRARVRVWSPIRPAGRLKGEAQEAFVGEATQRLYTILETCVRERPDQWVSAAFLHRWREPEPEAAPADAPSPEALDRHLADGGVLRLDPDRVVEVDGDDGPILADVRTLRAVRLPDWAAEPVRALASEAGLDAARLATVERTDARRLLALLGELTSRGMVMMVPSRNATTTT